jgi:DNA repair protein RadC
VLRQSSQETRQRFASYIVRRMFPSGAIDGALPEFGRAYAGRQELREVCFYRFCEAEPLMHEVVANLLLPSIGSGKVERRQVREYLEQRFPSSQNVENCAKGIVEALGAAGIASSAGGVLTFAYREVPLASFTFVLHSEFHDPGIYDIARLEHSRAMRTLLWNPDRLLPALYELRNRGIISKVSEIDTVRQFATRYSLADAVGAVSRLAAAP